MEKNKISRYLLIFSIFTFLAVFIFIVQKSYDNLMKPTQVVQKSNLLKPINPVLDTTTLDLIEKRQYFDTQSITVTPTLVPATQ